jgi:hypothetical protein
LPKRTSTEYVVHVCTVTGAVDCLLGEADAIVDVGVVRVIDAPARPDDVEPVDGLEDVDPLGAVEPFEAGAGDTMATVEVDGGDVVADVDVVEDDEPDDEDEDAGVELSLGTALANGLRAMRASSTLGDSFFFVSTFSVVAVSAPAGAADGGAGTV